VNAGCAQLVESAAAAGFRSSDRVRVPGTQATSEATTTSTSTSTAAVALGDHHCCCCCHYTPSADASSSASSHPTASPLNPYNPSGRYSNIETGQAELLSSDPLLSLHPPNRKITITDPLRFPTPVCEQSASIDFLACDSHPFSRAAAEKSTPPPPEHREPLTAPCFCSPAGCSQPGLHRGALARPASCAYALVLISPSFPLTVTRRRSLAGDMMGYSAGLIRGRGQGKLGI